MSKLKNFSLLLKNFSLLITSIIPTLLLTQCKQEETKTGLVSTDSFEVLKIKKDYAKLVYINYQDCVKTAQDLDNAISAFTLNPTEDTLKSAQDSWLAARVPYGQSEVFRFYAGPIDDEDGPEGLLNAWPLDEEYIESTNPAYKGILNDREKHPTLSTELLVSLNEKNGEENISTGYHAIEFMLWGKDTFSESAGKRPITDFTSDTLAERRKKFLKITSALLLTHLKGLEKEWQPDEDNYRKFFESLDNKKALQHILNGVGMLAGFELARERVDVPLNTMSQEDEHSCFSDNTHSDIYLNAVALKNVFNGTYNGVYYNFTAKKSPKLLFDNSEQLLELIDSSVTQAKALQPPFDQLITKDNTEGRAQVKSLVESLTLFAKTLSESTEKIGLQINIEE